LIVKTIAAGDPNDRAIVARSFSPRRGKKGGSTKDPVLAKAVTEAQKHGISKRTVQNARAKLQGKQPAPRKKIGVSATMPKSEAVPLGVSRAASVSAPSADVVADMTARLNGMLPASLRPEPCQTTKPLTVSTPGPRAQVTVHVWVEREWRGYTGDALVTALVDYLRQELKSVAIVGQAIATLRRSRTKRTEEKPC
jgi:hypothetical protein